MHYRYQPYPYYRRYYSLDPYYYRRYYYNPYYNYQQNIVDSQVSDVDQSIINYGDMTDVIQDSDVYQSMEPALAPVGMCTAPATEPSEEEQPAAQISIPL
jgi:hypothetical protein